MKYGRYLMAVLLVLSVALSGCQPETKDAVRPQGTVSPQQEKIVEKKIIQASVLDPRKAREMTKLREFSFDMDGDNEEENIELYTSAERNKKGEMMWDDGQQWLLLIQDGDSFYTLLSQYVQIGQVYFNVAMHGEEKLPRVTLTVSTGSGFRLLSYIYDSGKKGYTEELLYDSKPINEVFTSIPCY